MGPQTEKWLRTGIVAVALLAAGTIVVAGTGVGDRTAAAVGLDDRSAGAQVSDEERNLFTATASYVGAEENDTTGWSVTEAGDVNGDGETDVLVGAPGRHDDGGGHGAAYLFYGPVEGGEFDVSDADVTFEGPERADHTGASVAGGDIDGDGYADVVVGASHANSSERYAGAVYVVSGGDLNGTVHLADANATLEGEAWGDHAGYTVDVVSDTAGNESDVVVGAPYDDSVNRTAGAVYLLRGGDLDLDGTDELSLSDVGTKYAGEGHGDRAGWSVADAGDVNGDGLSDIVVGAPGNDTGGNDAGAAYVLHGDDGSAERGPDASLAEADAKVVGADADDAAGYSVDGAGDVNGDGYADVVVGAPYSDAAGDDAGAAHVLHGTDLSGETNLEAADLTTYGEGEGDIAGFAVSGGPCDERVFVGAPGTDETTGAVHVVAANATGTASLEDATVTVTGEARGDGAGFSLAGATNLSSDGSEELLIGAPYADSNANDSGTASLVGDVCPADEEAPDNKPIDTGENPRDDERADEDDGGDRADDGAEAPDGPGDDEDDTPLPTHDDPPERPGDRPDSGGDNATDSERQKDERRSDGDESDAAGNGTDDTVNGTDDTNRTDGVGNGTDGVSGEPGNASNDSDGSENATNDTDTEENVTNESDGGDAPDRTNDTADRNDTDGDRSDGTDDPAPDRSGENETDAGESSAEGDGTGSGDGDSENDAADDEGDGDAASNETVADDGTEPTESAVVGEFQSDNETATEGPPTTSIETGSTVSGDEQEAETRRFEFEVDDGEAVRVTLPGGTGDVRYTLYGPDGEEIDRGVPSSDARAIGGVADASGTYYVEATAPEYDALGPYRFRVTTSADDTYAGNDDRASAASVPSGEGIRGTLFEGEDDWYAVELTEGQTYLASFQLADSDTQLGNNVRIEMYDENGERVTATDESGPATTEKGIENRYWGEQVVEPDVSGTYYVRLTGADEPGSFDGYEEYGLTVAAVTTPDVGDGEDAMDEEEPTAGSGADENLSVESPDGENATDGNASADY